MIDPSSLSDEELVRRVCADDQELYGELVKRYQAKLLRYAGYFLTDWASAEDVVQESFLKAFVNLRGFNTQRKFSSWLYRIVHNEAINRLKKERRVVYPKESFWDNLVGRDPSPLEEASRSDLSERVRRCLGKLPTAYQAPLALYYLEEQSYQEISDTLRLPIGTVGTRIRRGRRLVADFCQQEGLGSNDEGQERK